jgi:[acyl-carrier-protein] S-malonyltransferase
LRYVAVMGGGAESILFLQAVGVEDVFEIGAGRVLAGLVKRVEPKISTRSVGMPAEVEALMKEF